MQVNIKWLEGRQVIYVREQDYESIYMSNIATILVKLPLKYDMDANR